MGSDAVALATAIAPGAARLLLQASEVLAMAVVCLSFALLAAVIVAIQVDFEVVAVTPAGVMLPLVQMNKDNELAQRAILGADSNPWPAQAVVQPQAAAVKPQPPTSPTRKP
jgi:hypothetical protein